MDSPILILFCFEANENLGLGHMIRCRSLAIEFVAQTQVDLAVCCISKKLVDSTFKGLLYNYFNPKELLSRGLFDVIVVDISDYSLQAQQRLKQQCNLLVGIDDYSSGPFAFDILIRPNALGLPRPKFFEDVAQIFQGKDYVILDPVYADAEISFQAETREILVCFGGSDPAGYTLRVVPMLKKILLGVIKVNLVIGSGFSAVDLLKELVGTDRRFEIFRNLQNLAELFSRSDAAIISGGTLLYEACALGVPSVILAQEQTQAEESQLFAERSAILCPADSRRFNDNEIEAAVKKICFEPTLRVTLHENALKSVSRDGSRRIVKNILKRCRLQ
jgi:spore coat polysaccharide biosynthesis predicted glycosyltransferase SpsG